MNSLVELPQNAVTLKDGHAIATSITVAEIFKKQHKDVLRAIRSFEIDEEFARRNFAPSSYINSQNKEQPMVEITRDGFTLLGMGFSGREAMQFKVAYIQRFNEMEGKSNYHHYGDALPATLTLEQHDAARTYLDAMNAQLDSTPITILPDELKRLREDQVLLAKKEWLIVDLVALFEEHDVPRELTEKILGIKRLTIRQHAFRARERGH